MEIVGHGVDLVELDRVTEQLSQRDDFLEGWFTQREIAELGERAQRADVVAGRIAAKEATAKALGTGFSGDVSWHDIEVLSNDAGAPIVLLWRGALEVARSLGIVQVLVSISHGRALAIASVITLGQPSIPAQDI